MFISAGECFFELGMEASSVATTSQRYGLRKVHRKENGRKQHTRVSCSPSVVIVATSKASVGSFGDAPNGYTQSTRVTLNSFIAF